MHPTQAEPAYAFYLCAWPSCGLRFPAPGAPHVKCPRCGRPASLAATVAASRAEPQPAAPSAPAAPAVRVEALLDNLRSLYNTGSIFRTADAAGISHLHLCGITPTPANRRLSKTALGAEKTIAWSYHPDAVQQAAALAASGRRLWALEESAGAISLGRQAPPAPGDSVVLIVGSEVAGVDPGVLALCERVLVIPMRGAKGSLNVATAFGIAAYALLGV